MSRFMIGAGLSNWIAREARRRRTSEDIVIASLLMSAPMIELRSVVMRQWRDGVVPMARGVNLPQRAMIVRDGAISLALAAGVVLGVLAFLVF